MMSQSKKAPQSILIVDDEFRNIQLLGSLLSEQSYEIEAAMNGEEALDWLKERSFDLVLLDIMMPGMDGYEVCRKIKENPATKSIPIIFLTAKAEPEEIVRGFAFEAVDYITKPFRTAELLSRVKTHLTIQKQRKELEELNASKNKFFSIIAHDLKSPFISLCDLLTLLNNPNFLGDAAKLKDLFILIQEHADRTYRLLLNLLDWAKLQQEEIKFEPKSFDIIKTIRETAELFKEAADKKNICICLELPDDRIEMMGEENMIATVFRNLINNAIKYTNSGGQITISYQNPDDHSLEFSVRDNGMGISDENMKKLFKIDKICKVRGTAGEVGTGLGLILCKEFIERHQGEIVIESQEGIGTIFRVVFNTKLEF